MLLIITVGIKTLEENIFAVFYFPNFTRNRHLLPSQTRWIPIEGGTNAQFGWYDPQKGENVATISQKDQQEIIINATLDLLTHLGN